MKNVNNSGFELNKQWEYENGYYLTTHSSRIGKLLAHYELFKLITNLPGEIIEFGVYKGASLVRWNTFREILESQFSRKIIGFDAFGEFPVSGDEEDVKFIKKFEAAGGNGLDYETIDFFLDKKGFQNYQLIQGDIFLTLPKYLEQNPFLKIALLHLDMDIYEPTKFVLEQIFDRVVPNGIIVIDDYNAVNGATRAVDEFVERKNLKLQKLSLNYIPTFIVR